MSWSCSGLRQSPLQMGSMAWRHPLPQSRVPVIACQGPWVAAKVPPAQRQEHGTHPVQWLAGGHPRPLLALLGSTSSKSACGSAEYPREATLHQPGPPKADLVGELLFPEAHSPIPMLESPEHSESPQASSTMITCALAREATRKQPTSHQTARGARLFRASSLSHPIG